MAKTKKSETATDAAGSKKPAAKKSVPKAAKPAGSPMIDTSLAAQAAAKMVSAGLTKPAAPQAGAPKPESSMFKQLKAGLSKPHASTMSKMLEKSHGPEPTKLHPQQKQVGHNQTFGADVTRSGVPRRTPG